MNYTFVPKGVCSRKISIEMDGELIQRVTFDQGCHGNLQGIARLVEGHTPAEVIRRLEGIDCRMKGTSCPDQLAQALKAILEKQTEEHAPVSV